MSKRIVEDYVGCYLIPADKMNEFNAYVEAVDDYYGSGKWLIPGVRRPERPDWIEKFDLRKIIIKDYEIEADE